MDAVALGSIIAVVGSIIVFVVLVVWVMKLINTTNSKD